jgi:hypothetical protein
MGATDFMTEATGRTPDEAYRSAVDDARYWHGHGGYSGSIAEKDGYELWAVPLDALPPLPSDMPRHLTNAQRLANVMNAIDWDVDQYLAKEPNDKYPIVVLAYNDTKALLGALGRQKFESLLNVYLNKWGPALAIKTDEETFTFMGLASC